MLYNGRWRDEQIIPQWFVEQTAAPMHEVKSPEMHWKLNPEAFSHGWETPAPHDPMSGHSGVGIPADSRSNHDSGGRLPVTTTSMTA